MPFFANIFRKDTLGDFDGVLVKLLNDPRGPSTEEGDDERESGSITHGSEMEEVCGEINIYTIEDLQSEINTQILASGDDTTYNRKSLIINKAIQDIGMGPFQWQLFVLCGLGWFADNLWLQGVALILPQLTLEFGPTSTEVRYTTCALFFGLCIGSSFWGAASDIVGRRLVFNFTLFIAGAFGLAVGAAENWTTVCVLVGFLGFGVGGSLPVDGALFLEFLPSSSSNLLTVLSIWWPVGQLVASLIAWGFIPTYSCVETLLSCNVSAAPCCDSADNKGWRYSSLTIGSITCVMFVCRTFFFHLYESPKYLLSRGRQEEAVASVHGIAYRNKRKTWLTMQVLNKIGGDPTVFTDTKLSTVGAIKAQMAEFSSERIRPLFSAKRLGLMTGLIWFCWAAIGMGYPLFNAFLPQYLQNAGKDIAPTPTYLVYRNYVITSIVGVPGSIIAYYTVEVKYIGRKGTIAVSTLLTSITLILFTFNSSSDYQLMMSSLEAFFQNIMYGVLYAYTPEVFPAPNRGTATGVASFFNRVFGLLAPIVAIHAGSMNANAPIYASAGLMFAAFTSICFFPIETRGRQTL